MDNSAPRDRRIDEVKSRLQADLTDSNGNKPDPELIEQAVDAAAAGFADAPVQDFVPLLVEHDARDELARKACASSSTKPTPARAHFGR